MVLFEKDITLCWTDSRKKEEKIKEWKKNIKDKILSIKRVVYETIIIPLEIPFLVSSGDTMSG
jgi:hypothetical protein